jgi:hypothetical protein
MRVNAKAMTGQRYGFVLASLYGRRFGMRADVPGFPPSRE